MQIVNSRGCSRECLMNLFKQLTQVMIRLYQILHENNFFERIVFCHILCIEDEIFIVPLFPSSIKRFFMQQFLFKYMKIIEECYYEYCCGFYQNHYSPDEISRLRSSTNCRHIDIPLTSSTILF